MSISSISPCCFLVCLPVVTERTENICKTPVLHRNFVASPATVTGFNDKVGKLAALPTRTRQENITCRTSFPFHWQHAHKFPTRPLVVQHFHLIGSRQQKCTCVSKTSHNTTFGLSTSYLSHEKRSIDEITLSMSSSTGTTLVWILFSFFSWWSHWAAELYVASTSPTKYGLGQRHWNNLVFTQSSLKTRLKALREYLFRS